MCKMQNGKFFVHTDVDALSTSYENCVSFIRF